MTEELSWAIHRAAALNGLVFSPQEVAGHLFREATSHDEARHSIHTAWKKLAGNAKSCERPLDQAKPWDFPAFAFVDDRPCLIRERPNGGYIVESQDGEQVYASLPDKLQVLTLRAPDAATLATTTARTVQRKSLSWFQQEIARFRSSFVEIGLGSLAANALALGGSIFSMQVYDRVIPNAAYHTLWVLAAGLLIAILFEALIRAARAQLLDSACKQIDIRLSQQLFAHLLAIKMHARPQALGTLAAQVRDFEVVRNFLTASSLFAIADFPFVLLFLVVMAWIGGPIAWIPLLLLIVTITIAVLTQIPLRRLSELHVAESNQKNGLLIEAIDGAEMVKATGAEWQMNQQWASLTDQLARDALHVRSVSNLSSGIAGVLQQAGYAGLIIAGAYLIGEGQLTMGGLIACSILFGRIFAPIAQIVGISFQWNHARTALKALDKLMTLPSDASPEARPVVKDNIQAHLKADGAIFTFPGANRPAMDAGQLEFRPGEKVAIVGPSGSGKSTLLKLLSGLYAPGQGRILLDGIDISHLDPRQVRTTIGFLPQEVRLFQGTLRDNLTRGLAALSDEEILAACRESGLLAFISSHPKGLGLELSEGGRGLSGGQKQLVGLTRTLLGSPRVLLLDEPSASMDQQLELQLVRALNSFSTKENLVIVVTHRPLLMKSADRIIVCDQNRVVLDGPRDEVLSRIAQPVSAAGGQTHARV